MILQFLISQNKSLAQPEYCQAYIKDYRKINCRKLKILNPAIQLGRMPAMSLTYKSSGLCCVLYQVMFLKKHEAVFKTCERIDRPGMESSEV